ncbi:LysR family transcriptional regulator [Variovorax sp. GB1P17]|uniref:LysR family transcriptional regulator n=1 Tax=Variovorax sp. GB1P17 TaxID=3443740 RepID=UPI003F46B0B8
MDSRFLQSFVSVVELGSIAEAARHLDMTPATIAQRVRALEADIGSQLIVRSGRTVRPTVSGTRILARARSVLRELRDLQSAASDTELPAGPLRLGAIPTGLMGIIPLILKDWVRRHPHIGIYIEPGSTTALYGRVMAGELDAAILVHPTFELPKTSNWHSLREEPLVLLTPARMKVASALATIAREPFIRYDRQVVGGKMADDYLRQLGIRPNVRVELDGIEYIAKLVAEGLGVSVLPDWAVIGAPNRELKKWPLPPPCPARTVGVLWQRSTVRAPLVEALVDIARAHFPQPPERTQRVSARASTR